MPFVLLKAYILFTSSLSSRASVVENVTDGSEALNFITEFVEKYMAGYSMIILLYGIAVLYLLIYGNKKIKAVVVMPSIVLMITFVNPFLINFIHNTTNPTSGYCATCNRNTGILEIILASGDSVSHCNNVCGDDAGRI